LTPGFSNNDMAFYPGAIAITRANVSPINTGFGPKILIFRLGTELKEICDPASERQMASIMQSNPVLV
jgi:hypothetical protein